MQNMNQPEPLDPLDACLREQNPHLEDGGFTARVMQALPRHRRAWLRPALLLGVTGLGSLLAVQWLPWHELAPLNGAALLALDPQVLCPWALVLSVLAALAWASVDALQPED